MNKPPEQDDFQRELKIIKWWIITMVTLGIIYIFAIFMAIAYHNGWIS